MFYTYIYIYMCFIHICIYIFIDYITYFSLGVGRDTILICFIGKKIGLLFGIAFPCDCFPSSDHDYVFSS